MADLTACLLYAKIHKNKGKNLLHLMLYFSDVEKPIGGCIFLRKNVVK